MPKRKLYTVEQKLEAVARVRRGESQAKISRVNGVPESTLRGWLKDEEKLREFSISLDGSEGLKRTGTPISGPILSAQAQKFSKELHGEDDDFLASRGWLHRFQKRHGISEVKVCGEVRSADAAAAHEFGPQLQEYITEHQLRCPITETLTDHAIIDNARDDQPEEEPKNQSNLQTPSHQNHN